MPVMLTRVYIHNYKCFQNFEFDFGKIHEAVIIGQNGSGKTTLACALDVLRQIGYSEETISRFTDENVFHLMRNSHLEPTLPMQSVAERKKSMKLVGEKEFLPLTGDLEG